jgi:hypothetical protein
MSGVVTSVNACVVGSVSESVCELFCILKMDAGSGVGVQGVILYLGAHSLRPACLGASA